MLHVKSSILLENRPFFGGFTLKSFQYFSWKSVKQRNFRKDSISFEVINSRFFQDSSKIKFPCIIRYALLCPLETMVWYLHSSFPSSYGLSSESSPENYASSIEAVGSWCTSTAPSSSSKFPCCLLSKSKRVLLLAGSCSGTFFVRNQ